MLYRPKEGKGQGTAGWSATLQDFRQNTSFASKEYPDMGTEFGCKICTVCRHLRAASMKPKSLQNSVSKRGRVVESFSCQLSSQLGSHLSVLVKPFQKAFWACKIVWGTFFAAGQSPARNCMHSAKPGSKNHFPGCVQSPYSLRAVNSSADPPSAEFPNSLPQKKELRIGIHQ